MLFRSDVSEACLSPTSPQVKKSSFSFSPVKIKNSLQKALSGKNDNVVEKEEPQKQRSQSCDSLESKNEDEKCVHEDSHLDQLRGRSNPGMELIFAKDSDEDGDLLTQIKDKKKELDDLIKKWKNSRNQKAVIDLTATAGDGDIIAEKKELPLGSSEIIEVMDTLEKQQCTRIEETENVQSALVIDDETKGQEKVVDAVFISESESEASSVEDVTDLVKQEDGVVEDEESSLSSNALQEAETTLSTDTPAEVIEDKKNAVSSDALQEVKTTLAANATDIVKDRKNAVSPDALGEVQNRVSTDATTETNQVDLHVHLSGTLKDAHLDVNAQDNEEMSVVEEQDSSEERRVEMDVDEPVAGPSGLPVEWQGATVVGVIKKKHCVALM